MRFPAIVAGLALAEYVGIVMLTGRARGTYKITAPATTGHPVFERWYRVQQNSVEQLVVFLPALYLFTTWVSAFWAGCIGLAFVAGRALYARSYVVDPATRGPGFVIGMIATLVLLVGGVIGALV